MNYDNIRFERLYGDIFACIKKYEYGNDEIIFPQNFKPVEKKIYKFLRIERTRTGKFFYDGKTYDVTRAYIYNEKTENEAGIIDQIEIKSKLEIEFENSKEEDNPFNVLKNLKLK